jgi:hypothetical protein
LGDEQRKRELSRVSHLGDNGEAAKRKDEKRGQYAEFVEPM